MEEPECVKRTSLDLIRYRTMRPLNAANVWLSKSGEFIPAHKWKILYVMWKWQYEHAAWISRGHMKAQYNLAQCFVD